MILKTTLFGGTYQFKSIKEPLAKANEEKSGDVFAGIAATSPAERIAVKRVLEEVTLEDLRKNPVIPYEEDEVTRVIDNAVREPIYQEIKNWSVMQLREYMLNHDTTGDDIKHLSAGLTAEMIAAVAKLMSNTDLVYAASKIKQEGHRDRAQPHVL